MWLLNEAYVFFGYGGMEVLLIVIDVSQKVHRYWGIVFIPVVF